MTTAREGLFQTYKITGKRPHPFFSKAIWSYCSWMHRGSFCRRRRISQIPWRYFTAIWISDNATFCEDRKIWWECVEYRRGPTHVGVGSIPTATDSWDTTLIEGAKDVPPLLGWVIVSHTLGKGDSAEDNIIIYGPVRSCTAETFIYFDAFKLLRLVERAKDRAQHAYWPW